MLPFSSQKMNRPRHLEELLAEFRCPDPDTLEEAIGRHFWARRFLDDLKVRPLLCRDGPKTTRCFSNFIGPGVDGPRKHVSLLIDDPTRSPRRPSGERSTNVKVEHSGLNWSVWRCALKSWASLFTLVWRGLPWTQGETK
jgi:hypothetical protein